MTEPVVYIGMLTVFRFYTMPCLYYGYRNLVTKGLSSYTRHSSVDNESLIQHSAHIYVYGVKVSSTVIIVQLYSGI